MATTLIPECPPVENNLSPEQCLEAAYEAYKTSMANVDKAGDMEAHEYNAGAADAYREMVIWLTGKDLLKLPV